MPRKQKQTRTLGGMPAQPIDPVPGQTYGMGQQQMDLQRTMPAPNIQPESAPTAARAWRNSPGEPFNRNPEYHPGTDRGDPFAAADAMPGGPGLLQIPSTRPGEPLTAGMRHGPGPGPEAVAIGRAGSPTQRTLDELYRVTGDPIFLRIAPNRGQR